MAWWNPISWLSGKKAVLVFSKNNVISVSRNEITIGRCKTALASLETKEAALSRDGRRIDIVQSTLTRDVSINHGRLTWKERRYYFEDCGSRYGSRINGRAVRLGIKTLLQNKDVVKLGEHVQFEILY